MIRVVFVTTICTIIVCTIRVIYAMGNNIPLYVLTTNLEVSLVTRPVSALDSDTRQAAVTLLMCDLLVLVTFVYRHLRKGPDLDVEHSQYLSRAIDTPVVNGLTIFTQISGQETHDLVQLTTHRGSSVFLEELGKGGGIQVMTASVPTPRIAAQGLQTCPPIMTMHSGRSVFPSPSQ